MLRMLAISTKEKTNLTDGTINQKFIYFSLFVAILFFVTFR
ncbi:MAG: hypothetical protein JWN14_1777 [Chthonomonadales bacterium]|nr:hypothetical protein [Chthonomonadales bacterium]